MMGFIIVLLGACHACLSPGLNKIGTHEGRSGISVLFANNIIIVSVNINIISVILRISPMCKLKFKVWVGKCVREVGGPYWHTKQPLCDILTDWGSISDKGVLVAREHLR